MSTELSVSLGGAFGTLSLAAAIAATITDEEFAAESKEATTTAAAVEEASIATTYARYLIVNTGDTNTLLVSTDAGNDFDIRIPPGDFAYFVASVADVEVKTDASTTQYECRVFGGFS